jgi:hypothetical protein
MLTDADGRSDGGRLAYLGDAPRFRDLDPPLFDVLAKLVAESWRDVLAVEAAMILPDTTFHADTLLNAYAARQDYFDKLWSGLGSDDLIFFDPDNGLEVPRRPRGRRHSSKYLYWDELARALDGGCSICVYQHFPRKPRAPFVAALLDRLGDLAPGNRAFAVLSPWVAYAHQRQVAARTRPCHQRHGPRAYSRWPGRFCRGVDRG